MARSCEASPWRDPEATEVIRKLQILDKRARYARSPEARTRIDEERAKTIGIRPKRL